jgi:dUTP pyrophosphatase
MIKIEIKEPCCMPTYSTKGSAGADVIAHSILQIYKGAKKKDNAELVNKNFQERGEILIRPFERILFGTGVILQDLSEELEIQVRSRSGLSLKKGLVVINSPGTIDSDYRQEIGVILYNSTPFLSKIEKNERIAQLVINKIEKTKEFLLEETMRNGGFGSTNK